VGASAIRARFRDQRIDYLAWAEAYVDQLDPLTSRPRSQEFLKRNAYFVNDLDRLRTDIGRLFGTEWPEAWKCDADYSRDPTKRYYYARSVFEVEDADGETSG
jgi:hypothetical protein